MNKADTEEFEKCRNDIGYFLRKYYAIKKPDGTLVPLSENQINEIVAMEKNIKDGTLKIPRRGRGHA